MCVCVCVLHSSDRVSHWMLRCCCNCLANCLAHCTPHPSATCHSLPSSLSGSLFRHLSLSVVSAQPIRRALACAGLVANAARFVFCRHLNSGLFNDFCNCFRERIFKIDFSERYFGFISVFRVFFLAFSFAFAFALPRLALPSFALISFDLI